MSKTSLNARLHDFSGIGNQKIRKICLIPILPFVCVGDRELCVQS